MLLLDFMSYGAASSYIDFISTMSWFRMYCVGKFGKNKADYLDGFQSLENSYLGLWFNNEEEKNFSKFIPSEVEIVLGKAKKLFNAKRFDEKQISEVGNLLFNFLNKDEGDFRNRYFDYKVRVDTEYEYPAELFEVVKDLLDNDHNDEAILNAFKYLDSHLQKLLQLSPHDYHGEDLINKAFAPNTGILQLGTHPSEQAGLRNFFFWCECCISQPICT